LSLPVRWSSRSIVVLLLAGAGLWPVLGALPARAQEDPPATIASSEAQQPSGEATDEWWLWRAEPPEPIDELFAQIVYQRFWDRRIAAFSAPDFDEELDLTTVLDGKPLADEIAALRRFQAAAQAQVIVVETHPTLVYATRDEFVIYDTYVNRSYVVDARSRAPLGPGPNPPPETVHMAYHLRKVPNATFAGSPLWKVVDSVHFLDESGDGEASSTRVP
jgi:hypothetical protein